LSYGRMNKKVYHEGKRGFKLCRIAELPETVPDDLAELCRILRNFRQLHAIQQISHLQL